jgi:hypothetical protein
LVEDLVAVGINGLEIQALEVQAVEELGQPIRHQHYNQINQQLLELHRLDIEGLMVDNRLMKSDLLEALITKAGVAEVQETVELVVAEDLDLIHQLLELR